MGAMLPSRSRDFYLLERSNGPASYSSTSTAPSRRDPASSTLADQTSGPPQLVHTVPRESHASYKAFASTTMRDGNGYTCHKGVFAAHAGQVAELQQGSARAVSSSLAIRPANRSNGAPLATIIEHGSYSTLNSHGSLLNIGQFPSRRITGDTSPSRASQGVLRNLEDCALQRIQENVSWKPSVGGVLTVKEDSPKDCGRSCLADDTVSAKRSILLQSSPRSGPQLDYTNNDVGNRKIGAVLRGFWQNVRAGSRTKSRSSSSMYTPALERRDNWEGESDGNLHSQIPSLETNQPNDCEYGAPYPVQTSFLSATLVPNSRPQTRNRKVSKTRSKHSTHVYPPLLSISRPKNEPEPDFSSVPPLLPPTVATRSRGPSPSVDLVPPEPRDVAHDEGMAGALPLWHENRHDTSAGYTFDGVSVLHNSTCALMEVHRARESSRNASFCSTVSTSYSGTVLGVDLDLDHEFTNPVRRSCSPTPVAPLWFTPQMALERQVSFACSDELKQTSLIEPPRRLITSSALTSLLPVAAASGIVCPVYDTPKISFYSPSGNLIQPEGESTLKTSASDFGILPTSHNSKKPLLPHRRMSARADSPPARPSLMPMTTPPTSSAPLPAHLSYHHNYRQPERSQIYPCEPFITHSPAIKGCGGVVRYHTLPPRTGVQSSQRKHLRSTRSVLSNMKREANFYKAQFIGSASTSCMLNHARNKNRNGVLGNDHRKRSKRTKRVNAAADNSVHGTQSSKARQHQGVLGPLVGHALRVGFCQPYDGAGKRTHAVAEDTLCLGRLTSIYNTDKEMNTSQAKEVDADLPATRIVEGTDNEGKRYGEGGCKPCLQARKHKK
ncbi:Nn.00g045720.m01.CDS01 [Neocucurbitaria sp. VM-36]